MKKDIKFFNKCIKCGKPKWKHIFVALSLPFSFPCKQFKQLKGGLKKEDG